MKNEATKLFNNKKILVLGLAKSGLAAAKLLSRLGARVTVNERQQREQCVGVEELEELGIEVICGGHPVELLEQDIYMIVKNPGIPYDIPFLLEAERRNIPVVTEVEIAYLISKAPIIGITGSNGKTTTTTLIFEMLKGSPKTPKIAGNIGTVFCEVAATAEENEWLVTELSSFQLLGTRVFKPQISLLLNIFDAHLDYHHTKDHYISAKANIFANQTASEISIFNYDNETTRGLAEQSKAQVAWFSVEHPVSRGAYIHEGSIVYVDSHQNLKSILPVSEVKLVGEHNVENILAAVAVACEADANMEQVQHTLRTFNGVPHRLQFIREFKGVKYYNDSKATNSLATKKALKAFTQPVILLAGGLDRGDEFTELQDAFRSQVKALIAFGQNAEKILKAAHHSGVNHIIRVDNVSEATRYASEIAQSGDIVLLSPASASWDQFQSFEERGDIFAETVHKLR